MGMGEWKGRITLDADTKGASSAVAAVNKLGAAARTAGQSMQAAQVAFTASSDIMSGNVQGLIGLVMSFGKGLLKLALGNPVLMALTASVAVLVSKWRDLKQAREEAAAAEAKYQQQVSAGIAEDTAAAQDMRKARAEKAKPAWQKREEAQTELAERRRMMAFWQGQGDNPNAQRMAAREERRIEELTDTIAELNATMQKEWDAAQEEARARKEARDKDRGEAQGRMADWLAGIVRGVADNARAAAAGAQKQLRAGIQAAEGRGAGIAAKREQAKALQAEADEIQRNVGGEERAERLAEAGRRIQALRARGLNRAMSNSKAAALRAAALEGQAAQLNRQADAEEKKMRADIAKSRDLLEKIEQKLGVAS